MHITKNKLQNRKIITIAKVGRGHWRVNYTGTQGLKALSSVGFKNLNLLIRNCELLILIFIQNHAIGGRGGHLTVNYTGTQITEHVITFVGFKTLGNFINFLLVD